MAVCNECKEEFLGRSDKRFCSSYCRSTWHNKKYHTERKTVRRVNCILRKNRQILFTTLDFKVKIITTQYLLEQGFNFGYFTSADILKNNKTCKYIYDIGYYNNSEYTFKIKLKKKKY